MLVFAGGGHVRAQRGPVAGAADAPPVLDQQVVASQLVAALAQVAHDSAPPSSARNSKKLNP